MNIFLVLTQDHIYGLDTGVYILVIGSTDKLINQKLRETSLFSIWDPVFNLFKTVLSQQKYLAFWTNINQCLCIYEGQVYTAHK